MTDGSGKTSVTWLTTSSTLSELVFWWSRVWVFGGTVYDLVKPTSLLTVLAGWLHA